MTESAPANANDGGGDFSAAYSAFLGCRDASVGVDGYCRSELSAASGLSNQDACGGPNTNIGFHTLIPFYAACEGLYHFRFHADYGYGGAVNGSGYDGRAELQTGTTFFSDRPAGLHATSRRGAARDGQNTPGIRSGRARGRG